MQFQKIKRIMKKNEKYTKMLDDYDKTGLFPLKKTVRSFTLRQMTIDKLKLASKNSGQSMSDIIDELVDKKLS